MTCRLPQRKGDFVIYGKPVSHGACAHDGVAQLINDHSAILPPEKRESHLASLGGARAAAQARARGLFRGGGMGSDHRLDGGDATLGSVSQLSKAMRTYLSRAASLNNVAMVRANGASRARQTTTPRAPHTSTRRARRARSPSTTRSTPLVRGSPAPLHGTERHNRPC